MGGFDPILFDLDGTVIDSVALIRESHRYAVDAVLGTSLSDEELVANVGRPLIDQMRAFSVPHAEQLLQVYREWNHAHTAELLAAYVGVDGLLERLRAAGRTLGIVTSKSGPTAQLAFDVLPIRHFFDVIVASEDSERHKPDPMPIAVALDRLGASPQNACYVGDAPFDIQAGAAAGLTTIGVTWGFFSREALQALNPTHLVDTAAQLESVLLGT